MTQSGVQDLGDSIPGGSIVPVCELQRLEVGRKDGGDVVLHKSFKAFHHH